MATKMNKTLIIANPAAQNGAAAKTAEIACGILLQMAGDDTVDLAMTESAGHAIRLAANLKGYDTVLALGGDGVVHEVVNGIMQRPKDSRPIFGVIPSGSGNDFAKAINMDEPIEKVCQMLVQLDPKDTDLGNVNGNWFAETTSYGLDAAIALHTVENRILTGKTGALLYVDSAMHELKENYRFYDYTLVVDNEEPRCGKSITFAVQNGPFYGGGFMICPEAKLDDGKLDICISHPPASRLKAISAFMKAKNGKHTKMNVMEVFQAKELDITFTENPPAQNDGERIGGNHFHITVEHNALKVIRP